MAQWSAKCRRCGEWTVLILLSVCISSRGVLIDRSTRNHRNLIERMKNTADLTEGLGYPAEQHTTETSDGYTLTLFRIPRPGAVPVFMQHGVYLNSDQWVLRGDHDLPILLYKRGYDVWMGNSRGTRYSRHRRFTQNDYQFWKWSSDDIALKDLPALIDYVLNTTNSASLSYIGHSRGSSGPIMMLSEKPEYNSKIHMLQLLAPVVYTTYAQCPIYYIAGNRTNALMLPDTFGKLMSMTRIGRVLNFPPPVRFALKAVCSTGTPLDYLCPILYFFLNGEDFSNFNYTLTPKLLDHFSEGMSVREVMHLQQISSANRFQKFDFGPAKNIKVYGTHQPPEYNISAVEPPVYTYVASNDLFLSKKDLKKFTKQVPNLASTFPVPYPRFNHIDYIWGNNANQLLFPKFLEDIDSLHRARDDLLA